MVRPPYGISGQLFCNCIVKKKPSFFRDEITKTGMFFFSLFFIAFHDTHCYNKENYTNKGV